MFLFNRTKPIHSKQRKLNGRAEQEGNMREVKVVVAGQSYKCAMRDWRTIVTRTRVRTQTRVIAVQTCYMSSDRPMSTYVDDCPSIMQADSTFENKAHSPEKRMWS